MNLNPFAKAIIAAAVAAANAFGAGALAHTPMLLTIAATIVAFAASLGATWAVSHPTWKAVLSGIVAAGGAVITTYGHADTLQVVISAVVAFATGAGLVSGVRNLAQRNIVNGRATS